MNIFTKLSLVHVLFFVLIGIPVSVQAIEIQIRTLSTEILEDAVLIAGTNGLCPYEAVALGDIDLSKTDHVFDVALNPDLNDWWLIGHVSGDVFYTSNVNMSSVNLYSLEPFDLPNAEATWPASVINTNLADFIAQTIQLSFGVMTDTHYYSEPLGTPHPIQQAEPDKFDLPGNLIKMQSALDQFTIEDTSFAVILGDMVEDHKAYPTIDTYVASGALLTNMDGLQNLFDQYLLPIHLVIGNHDVGSGTSRTDLYNHLTYYSQELYDNNDSANRFDYVFDVGNIRFIVIDNVNELSGANKGFRSASLATQMFLQKELDKVSTGGIDESKPVIIMNHARVDCLVEDGCSQKIDLTNGVYQWTKSSGGMDEYYLELTGGGDPVLLATEAFNRFLWINNTGVQQGTIGSLEPGRWNYGNNPVDSITFDTVYVRLDTPIGDSSWDPDDAMPGYLEYKYVVTGASMMNDF